MSLATTVASLVASKFNLLIITLYGQMVRSGIDPKPILPNGRPKGSAGVVNGAKYILGWLLLIGVVVGLAATLFFLIRGLFSERYRSRDALKPLGVTLVLGAFSTVFGIVAGIFNGVVGAFHG